ncbi:MAG: AlkZ family DNA glycosylase [Nocardioides sp.]|nr:AlkZ family DNA glycosylase [Nocardioides sp.]
MILSHRRLNRTLLHRQHLLSRTSLPAVDLIAHLVGLQAQDPLPPFLGLHARTSAVDPYAVSALLSCGELVRLSTLRSTIHLHTAADAGLLRAWTQPVHDYYTRTVKVIAPAAPLERFAEAVEDVLSLGALPQPALGGGLVEHFPDVPPKALGLRARNELPLVQLPPRGLWKGSGGVVYDLLPRWTGVTPVPSSPSVVVDLAPEIVHRYLRAFGPATAADITTWSGLTRLGPVVKRIPGLVTHRDETGKTLYDVADGELADETSPAPVRLLGTYDNLWLAHSARSRVTLGNARATWASVTRERAGVLLVDGYVTGFWKPDDGRVKIVRLLRDLTPAESDDLAEETTRVEAFLAL